MSSLPLQVVNLSASSNLFYPQNYPDTEFLLAMILILVMGDTKIK